MDTGRNLGIAGSRSWFAFNAITPQQKRIERGVPLFPKGIAKIDKHESFSWWAADNPTEFYRIAAHLISTEIKSGDGDGHTLSTSLIMQSS
jgi:hypothetical protein